MHVTCQDARREEWIALAKRVGYTHAADIISASDMSQEWMFAELIIAFAAGRIRGQESCFYDVAHVESSESIPIDDYGDDWLLKGKPEGTVVPPASGRETARMPNLNSANPTFAAMLIKHVNERFGGDAPKVYAAAKISRKTYSAIVGNELRPVSKQTAIQLAPALKLSRTEADALLKAAGFAFSPAILEDIIVCACISANVFEIDDVNSLLTSYGSTPFSMLGVVN